MSIRAMNWAMGARTDGVSAQCVLFVVADTANEHGVSIHADPDYIAARTRQSRATVFRRLKELEQAGALTRLKRFREDGAPVYEIRLKIDNVIDYDTPPDDGGAAQDMEAESQIETPPESQSETGTVSPVRQAESQSCDSIGPSKNPEREESPQAPLRGVSDEPSSGGEAQPAEVEGWTEFKSAWEVDGVPMARPGLVKPLIAALSIDERQTVAKAAKGYLHHRSREKKPGTKLSAQNFVREIEAWTGWAKLAPADPAKPKPKVAIQPGSDEFKALALCRAIARRGAIDPGPVVVVGNIPAGAAGLAALVTFKPGTHEVDQTGWTLAAKGSPRYVAWCERAKEWLGFWPEDHRYWLDEMNNIVANASLAYKPLGKHLPRCRDGLMFPPLDWPPAKSSTDPPPKQESTAA